MYLKGCCEDISLGEESVEDETKAVVKDLPMEDKDPEVGLILTPQKEVVRTEWVGAYGGVKDQSCSVKFKPRSRLLQWAELSFNPVVSGASLLLIFGFVLWAMLQPGDLPFAKWKAFVGNYFTWLYIGAQDGWAIFVVYIFFSKYGNIKLGPDDSRPEYNDISWFCMLFACGLSTGLFFCGVSEPIYHYTGNNRYSADPSMPDNKLAQMAMTTTLYHWGIHGWVVYTLLGLILALMAHREGLPLTMKSIFFPLIGERVFGWVGDFVDTLSVIATLCGVCTGLGVGCFQINQGLHLMNPNINEDTKTQVVIIWSVTFVATCSVLSGVGYGIRRISEFCFCTGIALMLVVLLMDETSFLLNLYVQSMGSYASSILQLGFHTDAFEQLGSSSGASDRGRLLPPGVINADGPDGWMNDWTIFYWGWWIAWCPFVGMFIAKISVGRTVREFILGTMCAPVIYVGMWFVLFGGAGMRMEREAASAGLCCHNLDMNKVAELAVMRPDDRVQFVDGLCGQEVECSNCSLSLLNGLGNATYKAWGEQVDRLQDPAWWGVTQEDRKLTRLSCRRTEEMWFDMMMSYGDLGPLLSGFSLVSLVLYFVTSSDSGSLVIDCLASNGHPNPPRLQRLLWALTQGLAATAILVAGGKEALTALQAMAITTGLFYNVLMCLACVALWRALQIVAGDRNPRPKAFPIHVLDPFFADPFPKLCSTFTTRVWLFLAFIKNIFLAPLTLAKVSKRLNGSFWTPLVLLYIFYLLTLLLTILQYSVPGTDGSWALAWVSYATFSLGVTMLRGQARERLTIPGSPLEDFLLSLVFYPSVALQLDLATIRLE